jgi:N-acetylglutamate synthase-like GNAT family acetyltransferase
MSRPFTIRKAAETDAEAIANLSTVLGYSADAETMRKRLQTLVQSEADLIIVAVNEQGTVIGWLQAHANHALESGFRVEIMGLIVSPDARRTGAGRSLVAEAEEWARTLSVPVVVVRSNLRRTESHAFYPAIGFKRTKTQAVYRKPLAQEEPNYESNTE